MKRSILMVLLLCAAFAGLSALPLTATWIEGDVSLKTASGWKPIMEGDRVDSASIVQLTKGSYAEFSSAGRKVSLSSAGTFTLDSLLNAGAAQANTGSGVVGKMGLLVTRQAPRSSTVAGVRGDFEGAPEKTEWAVEEDDPSVLAEDARTLLGKNNYKGAAEKFGTAADEALGDEREEYRYSQAWCYAADNQLIRAVKLLRDMRQDGPYGVPRDILLARLNLDTGATAEARVLLDGLAKNPALSTDDAALVKDMRAEAEKKQ